MSRYVSSDLLTPSTFDQGQKSLQAEKMEDGNLVKRSGKASFPISQAEDIVGASNRKRGEKARI